MIAGRRGNDLLVGDSPIATSVSANDIRAGDGADVIDARGYAQAHPPSRKHLTSRIDCGPGRDRVLSETDDSVVRNCQGAVFRIQNLNGLLTSENDLYGLTMKLWPVARDEQSVTYEVPCPSAAQEPNTGCSGSITLTSPPPGGNEPGTVYGSTDFDLEPGERAPVRVELSPEGRQAVVHDPVDVEIDAALSQGAGAPAEPARFGWEQVLGPANP